MKLKDILIGLLGIQLLFILYYLPQNIKSISRILEHGVFANLSYILGTLLQYLMMIIGVIGSLKYFKNKNIFNPYLKAFFIYDFFNFLAQIPNIIYFGSGEYANNLEWSFYFFQFQGLLMVILVVIIFPKEKVMVNVTPGKKKRTRFYHSIIDNFFLLIVMYQMLNSPFLSQYYYVASLILPYFLVIIYYWLTETVFQQTIGKVVTGRYVRREDGERASGGKILGRTLSRLIPFEPLSFFSYPVRGWHDSISKTNVYALSENQEEEDEILKHLVDETDDLRE